MKVQRKFLSSRAGSRIFWALLLAAAVPIAVFGVTMHQLLSQQFQTQVAKQQVQLVKFAGMGLLDRLIVARTALSIVARTGRVDSGYDAGSRSGRVLLEVAYVNSRGHVLAGDAALAQRWRKQTMDWASRRKSETATLLLGADHDAPSGRKVLMVLVGDARRDGAWIAEVEPAFLFNELSSAASGSGICVFDSASVPIFCPGSPAQQVSHSTQWRLFLRSDFAIDDWVLATTEDGASELAGESPLARVAALAALATLLFVGVLALIQVRRTMVPLELLIAGTRRLSERDYGARVRLQQSDEFGELARSFNHMAERIDHQISAMRVQSTIDYEILNGLDVARVLQSVAQRIERIVPSANAWIIEFDRSARALARIHSANSALRVAQLSPADANCGSEGISADIVPCDAPSKALQTMAPGHGRLWLCCARVGEEALAVIMLRVAEGAAIDVEARREITELCGRVSVALASADRERRLVERATRDSLTGLANRSGLYDAIDQMLEGRGAVAFSVLFLDLDGFKDINDSLGHHVGDQLLCTVARRLQANAPVGTLVARPGGDEFVLVVRGAVESAHALATVVLEQLVQPIELEGRKVVIGTSVGIAHHPTDGASALDLMRRADLAMFSAKARGGGAIARFDPSMDTRIAERAALLADLRQAVERREFEVHYQPRVHVRTNSVKCAEALLRWRCPRRGLVPPDVFIPLLEETGLIDQVGLWVVDQAAAQLERWRAQHLPLESIAVNVSTRQLQADDLPTAITDILARHGLRPADLELEVTESIFMGDKSTAVRALEQLHEIGIRIALDDFGTGYSSLSYLHRLPIELIKVDRSFVSELGQRESARALTRSIIVIARALGMRVVAEGVETEGQLEILIELGCDELQGWLYAPALDPVAFARFMQQPLHAALPA